jgi:hypothetical protein
MKKVNSVLSIVIVTALIALGFVMVMKLNQYLKMNAVDECAKYATVKWINKNNGDAEITEPNKVKFDECMEKKGYH